MSDKNLGCKILRERTTGDGMAEVVHREIKKIARPARAAVLLPNEGDAWPMVVKSALESLSLTWGGIGDILVPTDAEGIPLPVFRKILKAFDPDYICGYLVNPSDLTSTAEAALVYQRSRNRLTPGIATARTWCSPFRSPCGYFPVASSGQSLGPPLVPLTNFQELGETADIDLSSYDDYFELMVRMRFGGIPFTNDPKSNFYVDRVAPATNEDSFLGDFAMVSKTNQSGGAGGLGLFCGMSMAEGSGRFAPLHRTAHGMGWINYSQQDRWVIVTGNTCEDFCLALACDRIFTGATWLPEEVASQDRFRDSVHFLLNARRSLRGQPADTIFTSASLEEDKIESFWARHFTHNNDEAYRWSTVALANDLDFCQPKRIASLESFKEVESSTCYLDESGTLTFGSALSSPIPVVARRADPAKIAWEIEVSVEGSQAPARGQLDHKDLLVVGLNSSIENVIDVRVSSNGIVYHSHPVAGLTRSGWLLEQYLLRPRLRVPGATDVIRSLAESAGYDVRASQTGRLNQIILNLWGSLESTALDLKGPVWNLLSEFLIPDHFKVKDGPQQNSLVIHGIPYLTASNAMALLVEDEQVTRDILDRLIERDILRRGLLLRCSRCNWADWYAAGNFGQRFECRRCTHQNVIVKSRWQDPILEPKWYYDLDHAVREGLCKNGRVPILALEKLRSESRHSFTYCTDFELVRMGNDKPELEIDFAVVRDGTIIIGEAKTNDSIDENRRTEKQKITRFVDAASKLSADAMWFVTSAKTWNQVTRSTIQETATAKELEVMFVEGLGDGQRQVVPSSE